MGRVVWVWVGERREEGFRMGGGREGRDGREGRGLRFKGRVSAGRRKVGRVPCGPRGYAGID
jgi:hypothetical protein